MFLSVLFLPADIWKKQYINNVHDHIFVLQYLSFWSVSHSSCTIKPFSLCDDGSRVIYLKKKVLQTQNLHAVWKMSQLVPDEPGKEKIDGMKRVACMSLLQPTCCAMNEISIIFQRTFNPTERDRRQVSF